MTAKTTKTMTKTEITPAPAPKKVGKKAPKKAAAPEPEPEPAPAPAPKKVGKNDQGFLVGWKLGQRALDQRLPRRAVLHSARSRS